MINFNLQLFGGRGSSSGQGGGTGGSAGKATIEDMKQFIKNSGKASSVEELVRSGEWDVNDAIEYVYDRLTLTRKEFLSKYFK